MQQQNQSAGNESPPPPSVQPLRLHHHLRRGTVWLLEGLGVAAAGIVILAAVLAFRLSQGPLPVNFLTPTIVAALEGIDPGIDVAIGETVLIWSGAAEALQLRARGVHVHGPQGEDRASIPELSVSLSIPALFHGLMAPSALEVYGLRLSLVRTVEGTLQFGYASPQPEAVDVAPPVEPSAVPVEPPPALTDEAVKAVAALFAGAPDPAVRGSYLRRISVIDAEFVLDDRKAGHVWRAPEAHLSVIRDRAGAQGQLVLAVDLNGTHPRLDIRVRYRPGDTELTVDADLSDLDPAAIATAIDEPVTAPLRGLDATLTGKSRMMVGLDGSIHNVALTLDAGPGRIFYSRIGAALGGDDTGLPLGAAHLEAHLSDAFDRLTINRLDLVLDNATLNLSGEVRNIDAPVPEAHFEVATASLPIPTLIRYWPEKALVNVREWLVENLGAGSAEDVRIAADIGPGGPVGALDVTMINGTFGFKGLSVAYFRPLPNGEDISGTATLTTDKLTFVLDRGRIADLSLGEATVVITGLDVHDQDLAVEAVASGPLKTALGILDSPRLEFMKEVGIKPGETSGETAVRLRLKLPLEHKVAFSDVDLLANATVRGAMVPKIALGLDVVDGAFNVVVDGTGMVLRGTAKIGGADARTTVQANFSGSNGFERRIHFQGTLDGAARETIGVSLDPYVTGPMEVEAILTRYDSHRTGVDIVTDLSPSTITVSDFGWGKNPDEKGMASVRATLRDDKLTSIDQLEVRADDLFVSGRVGIASDGKTIASANLPEVKFGQNDVRVNASRNAAGAYLVQIGGAKVDVEPLLNAKGDDGAKPGPPMIVDVAVGVARLGQGGGANGVSGHLERDDKHWRTMTIDGGLSDGKPMAVRMRPDGNGRTFSVTGEDAGALLKALDVTSNVVGGTLSLDGRYDDSDARSPFKGTMAMRNYRLEGAPLVAKVLSVASLTGILNALTGQGIDFSQFNATVTFVDGSIYTEDLRAHGSALGFTGRGSVNLKTQTVDLQGTVVPAYSVNSVLGNIPLLGSILTGPEGGGVFAANYRMRGPLDDPTVTVNPLATLAPGILRNIFNIFGTPAQSVPPPEAAPPVPPAPTDNNAKPVE